MRPLAEATPAGHGLDHPAFDGEVRDGMLVVHKRAPPLVVDIFRELFNAMFRIEEMQSYETYPVGEYVDQKPTIGFTIALLRTTPSALSWHAFGLAVDINPWAIPYQDPKEGRVAEAVFAHHHIEFFLLAL